MEDLRATSVTGGSSLDTAGNLRPSCSFFFFLSSSLEDLFENLKWCNSLRMLLFFIVNYDYFSLEVTGQEMPTLPGKEFRILCDF